MPYPSGILRAGKNLNVGAAAARLYPTDVMAAFGVLIKADKDNTDNIWVGGEDLAIAGAIANNGFPLVPGEAIFVEMDDIAVIYIASPTGGQWAWWAAV